MLRLMTSTLAAVLVLGLAHNPSANAAVNASVIADVEYPVGIAQDAAGNTFIAKGNGDNQGLVVVPAADGTLFGQSVVQGREQLVAPLSAATGVAVNAAGDVFVCTSGGVLYVITRTTKDVFGVSNVPANTLTQVATGAMAGGMEFDAAGNLFGGRSGNGGVVVLPASNSTIFGQLMTANVVGQLNASNLDWTADVAFDTSGNLYITQMFDSAVQAGVYVVPVASGTLYGVSVTVNVVAALATYPSFGTRHPCGIDIDSSGTIFYVSWIRNSVYAMPTSSATVFGQNLSGNAFAELTETSGYANQGVLVESADSLVTGGPSKTYRLTPVVTFTVVFDANAVDATGAMSDQVASVPTALTANVFERVGYSFAGWSTSPTGAIMYPNQATYPFTSSTTLYARWAAPGEDIPIFVRVIPPDVFQSVPFGSADDCSDIIAPELNWAGTVSGGWTKSWAYWPNQGSGGLVCNRTLRYSTVTERWFTVL
jgi:Listeria-Bacteroides repeat domain (List_Bact_rpt)